MVSNGSDGLGMLGMLDFSNLGVRMFRLRIGVIGFATIEHDTLAHNTTNAKRYSHDLTFLQYRRRFFVITTLL